jgi:hypothetical protein
LDSSCDSPTTALELGDKKTTDRAQPLTAAAWEPVRDSELKFVFSAVALDGEYPWLDQMEIKGRTAAEVLKGKPEGRRVMFSFWLPKHIYSRWPESDKRDDCLSSNGADVTDQPSIWRENGIATAASKYREFFDSYKAAGGPAVDSLILDYEEFNFPTENAEWQNAMVADPRYFYGNQNYDLSDYRSHALAFLLGADRDGRSAQMVFNPPWASPLKGIFFTYLNALKVSAVDEAAIDVARSYFPHITGSDWLNEYVDQDRFFVPEGNGHAYSQRPDPKYPITELKLKLHVGTHQATATYHSLNQITWPLRRILLDGLHTFTGRPHNFLLYNQNRIRANMLSSTVPLHIWIPAEEYYEHELQAFGEFGAHPGLYQESILHAALANPDRILFWNIESAGKDSAPLVDAVLSEFNALVGSEARRSLVIDKDCDATGVSVSGQFPERCLLPWDSDFVLSGIEVGDRRIYRFTADTDFIDWQKAIHVQSDEKGVTVTTARAEVRFEGAVVYAPTNSLASGGIWLVARKASPSPKVSYRGADPFVNAGIDQTITLPNNAVRVYGSADYESPQTNAVVAVPVTWSQRSGPVSAAISDLHAVGPIITFSQPGTYRFRMTGAAGGTTRYDDLTVRVLPEPEVSP